MVLPITFKCENFHQESALTSHPPHAKIHSMIYEGQLLPHRRRRPFHLRPPRGQGMVEYGLIVGLIAVLVVTIFVVFDSVVGIGSDSSGTLSEEGVGRAAATLSSGVY